MSIVEKERKKTNEKRSEHSTAKRRRRSAECRMQRALSAHLVNPTFIAVHASHPTPTPTPKPKYILLGFIEAMIACVIVGSVYASALLKKSCSCS